MFLYNFFAIFVAIFGINTPDSPPINDKKMEFFFFADTAAYQKAWKTVDSLAAKGLVESALEKTNDIYQKAQKDNNADQIVKSIMRRITFAGAKQEEPAILAIQTLQKEIQQAEFPVKPVLQSMLAEAYWNYYRQNRWKFLDRTATADFKPDDLRTWAISQIVEETIKQYQHSLGTEGGLAKEKTTPVGIFHEILGGQATNQPKDLDKTRNRNLRPTLYDLLAHRAADFFMDAETDLTQPAYAFELDNPQYFATAEDFAKINIASKDSLSTKFYALSILQDLTEFRLANNNTDALADVELKRIQFVYQHATIANKADVYLAALEKMQEKYKTSPIAAEFGFLIANQYAEKTNLKKAVAVAESTIKNYPKSIGAIQCQNKINEIKNPVLELTNEQINAANAPFRVLVNYKNLQKIYIKIIKSEFKEFSSLNNLYGEEREKLVKTILARPAVNVFEQNLPSDDGDFLTHAVEIKMPALPLGYYLVFVADNNTFKFKENTTTANYMQVSISNLAFSSRNSQNSENKEFYLYDRNTGETVAGATVNAYQRDYNYTKRRYEYSKIRTQQTDNEGFVSVKGNDKGYETINVEFIKNADVLNNNQDFYVYGAREKKVYTSRKVFFFTDRAIYRPGQTIYFKAILLQENNESHKILPNESLNVTFYNANRQEISKLELRTNDFGSVSGSFIAPVGVLNGQMFLRAEENEHYFAVEEYKRPKFEVTFEATKGSYKLGEKVSVKGIAKAYSGANIDGALVSYRVVRKARYPSWWARWYGAANSTSMEITNGKAKTDEKGEFEIVFEAIPDATVDKKTNPIFDYAVSADVTDLNGETQSGNTTVSVAYKALELSTNIPDRLDIETLNKSKDAEKTAFEINSQNLSGQFEPTTGEYVIYKLKTPTKIFRERLWQKPDKYVMNQEETYKIFPFDVHENENEMLTWKNDKEAKKAIFNTENNKRLILKDLETGAYKMEAKCKDKYGEDILLEHYFTVFSPKTKTLHLPQNFAVEQVDSKSAYEPKETVNLLIGSSHSNAKVLLEIESEGNIVSKQWISLDAEQKTVPVVVQEAYRGNFGIHCTLIKNGRFYTKTETINVPHTNKLLDINFETFRNKLQPAEKEEWRLTIKGKQGDKVAAEMIVTLYDASLDAFRVNSFRFDVLNYYSPYRKWAGHTFGAENANNISFSQIKIIDYKTRDYDDLIAWENFYQYARSVSRAVGGRMENPKKSRKKNGDSDHEEGAENDETFAIVEESAAPSMDTALSEEEKPMLKEVVVAGKAEEEKKDKPKAEAVKVRTNFNETAFFMPHLQTDEAGNVVIKFTIPESLTRWKMLGFAHTKDLKHGFAQNSLITQKDLMIVPNAPRFFREGDEMTFAAKITNLSQETLNGSAQVHFFDALTMKPVDASLFAKNVEKVSLEGLKNKSFEVKAGQSTVVSWKINIPEGQVQAITYRVVAQSGNFSDGEEAVVPVLTNRMLVTETMPLWVRGGQTKTFELKKLAENKSTTLKNEQFTLEFTSNPAWYAVQALPYLMEYPYECSEQIFSRFYANSLASHIANSNPKMKTIFETWKNTNSQELVSNLDKNQELKYLLLEETPWVLNAQSETERKKRLGLLLDLQRMASETDRTLTMLEKKQASNGGFPWFEGMPESRWITQHIVSGLGHLDKLGVRTVNLSGAASANNYTPAVSAERTRSMMQRAVQYLDDRIRDDYEDLKRYKAKLDDKQITSTQIHYLYARSFFKDFELKKQNKDAFDYYFKQAKKYWLGNGLYLEAQISLIMLRYGEVETSKDILKSLKERSLQNEELGMYWRDLSGGGWWWYQAPIETQSLLIEAFAESNNYKTEVEEMKVWLLKQKQTQDWKTTKATAEACYALLLQGNNWLANDELAEITVGKQKIDPKTMDNVKVEAGTGYFKTSWQKEAITKEMAKVTVKQPQAAGIAWGGIYWQYFENLDKITFAETPLKLKKDLFLQENSPAGLVLKPINDKNILKVGDVVKVRIELRVDRDMEYVHLKDMRAAGFEPVNVLSQYKYQGGLGYYESTRDAATNFFIGYLSKGTYIFEYPLRVAQKGDFSNGITTIQSMYAPEFTAHSQGIRVKVE